MSVELVDLRFLTELTLFPSGVIYIIWIALFVLEDQNSLMLPSSSIKKSTESTFVGVELMSKSTWSTSWGLFRRNKWSSLAIINVAESPFAEHRVVLASDKYPSTHSQEKACWARSCFFFCADDKRIDN